ncbi:MAG TPA: YlxR family protein [Chloroflexota bacterium]|nr:YlxR family protein [Chloroflexota bacterium]
MLRQKHIPQRTCVGCGQLQAKRQMVRVVRTVEGPVVVDPTGKRTGRGAYLCKKTACWDMAMQKSSLNRALKTEVSSEDREELIRYSRLFGAESSTQSAPEADGEAGS